MSVETENDSTPSSRAVYSKPVTCVLTTEHWVALGGGVDARMEVISRMADMEDVSGRIEIRIRAIGESPKFKVVNPVIDAWCDITSDVSVMRIGPNVLRSRMRELSPS